VQLHTGQDEELDAVAQMTAIMCTYIYISEGLTYTI
jgi:hypothetical protein